MTEKIKIEIKVMSDNGHREYRKFSVPFSDEADVLNALEYIHENEDPNVYYRSSCRRGVCGACLMKIDNKMQLACETELKKGMKIDPFSNPKENGDDL